MERRARVHTYVLAKGRLQASAERALAMAETAGFADESRVSTPQDGSALAACEDEEPAVSPCGKAWRGGAGYTVLPSMCSCVPTTTACERRRRKEAFLSFARCEDNSIGWKRVVE